jgi:hypothetical protein
LRQNPEFDPTDERFETDRDEQALQRAAAGGPDDH